MSWQCVSQMQKVQTTSSNTEVYSLAPGTEKEAALEELQIPLHDRENFCALLLIVYNLDILQPKIIEHNNGIERDWALAVYAASGILRILVDKLGLDRETLLDNFHAVENAQRSRQDAYEDLSEEEEHETFRRLRCICNDDEHLNDAPAQVDTSTWLPTIPKNVVPYSVEVEGWPRLFWEHVIRLRNDDWMFWQKVNSGTEIDSGQESDDGQD